MREQVFATQQNFMLSMFGGNRLVVVLFGFDVIDEAMKPFRDYQPFINLMETLGRNPILGALIGALFTVLI